MRAHAGILPFELSQVMGEANTAWVLGDFGEAVNKARAVITKAPSHAPAYSLLGLAYEHEGKKHLALDAFRLAAHAAPEDPACWRQLGVLARELGDDGLARSALSKVARLAPDDLPAIMDAAELFQKAGDSRKAAKLLRIAVVHPNCPEPASLLMKIADMLHAER